MPGPQRRITDSEPGLAEVVRRLEEVVVELREMRRSMETTYVRLDVYDRDQSHSAAIAEDLRKDLDAVVLEEKQDRQRRDERERANRLLAISGIVLPILSGLVLALLLAALLPQGATP